MFEQASNLDAGEEPEDRQYVHDLDILLNYADDEDASVGMTEAEQEAQRQHDIAQMRAMAAMVNQAMGGQEDG